MALSAAIPTPTDRLAFFRRRRAVDAVVDTVHIDEDRCFREISLELQGLDSRAPSLLAHIVDAVRSRKLRTPVLPQRALELIALTQELDQGAGL